MLIIGIESSALVASVAVMEDDRLIAEYTMNNKQTHSQTLLPMLSEICRAAELELADVDAIAISRGPGSFTGLRIGSATAKGLGLALDKPLIEVPTLDAMAFNLFGTDNSVICPIMDARRQEVYSGIYDFDGDELRTLVSESAGALTAVIDKLNDIGRRTVFLGDAVPVYRSILEEQMKTDYIIAPPHLSRQRAASVAALGIRMLAEGKTVSAAEHAPTYLRVSQAEREKGQ